MATNFNITESSSVNQLLNRESINLGARNTRITKLDRASLVFLDANSEVYPDVHETTPELEAMAKDISEAGVQQPLVVYPLEGTTQFVVLSGNRRLAAIDLAQSLFGTEIEYVPCIVQDAPADKDDLMMRVIKNNLQRNKSSWTRMREVAVYYHSVKEKLRKDGQKGAREIVKEDLGVSDSEISRYMKIYNNLIPELMEYFRTDNEGNSLISTNVAYDLACRTPEEQQMILSLWDKVEPLTLSHVTNLIMGHEVSDPDHPTESPEEKNQTEEKESDEGEAADGGDPFTPVNLTDGLKQLQDLCADLADYQIPVSTTKGAARTEQKLMRKLSKELARVAALKEELNRHIQKYGSSAPAQTGETM